MPTIKQKITPFLWFDSQAEEAVAFYTSIFRNSRVLKVTHYEKQGSQVAGRPEGSVMTIVFELEGQEFVALNGGPVFRFSEAVSFVVTCQSQEEIDHYWNNLAAGGDRNSQQCGWLKDRFGLSWQIVPAILDELLSDPDPAKAGGAMAAMLKMKKIEIDVLRQAAEEEIR
jgi:predicted 3-demethylubiquinone-9 3-methyltransferase (glyoxalase superfamily)